MFDLGHLYKTQKYDYQTFYANASTTSIASLNGVSVWNKPRGAQSVFIICIGAGGSGGNGSVGAVASAGGGGGGGSGGQTTVWVPAMLIPDNLYVSVAKANPPGGSVVGYTSVGLYPMNYTPAGAYRNDCIAMGTYGTNGSNATAGTGGGAGAAGAAVTFSNCPLAGIGGIFNAIKGEPGTAGGNHNLAGGNVILPNTGLIITGGTGGGGGANAINDAGLNGGSINIASPTSIVLPSQPGGIGGTSAPTAGGAGSNGSNSAVPGLLWFLGGTGGGSSGTSAASGSNGGNGGNGGYGCGGGGGGAAFTGFTAGIGGYGGDGIVIIITFF